jgi:hypothetical protein
VPRSKKDTERIHCLYKSRVRFLALVSDPEVVVLTAGRKDIADGVKICSEPLPCYESNHSPSLEEFQFMIMIINCYKY